MSPARADPQTSPPAAPPRPTRLLIAEPPLQVLPSLAVRLGLSAALFLQQLHFWLLQSPHVFDGCRWIYNSYEDWHAQLPFWSVPTIRRVVTRLERPLAPGMRPLIRATARYNRHPLDQTKWYTINYDVLEALLTVPPPSAPPPPDADRAPRPAEDTDGPTTPEDAPGAWHLIPEAGSTAPRDAAPGAAFPGHVAGPGALQDAAAFERPKTSGALRPGASADAPGVQDDPLSCPRPACPSAHFDQLDCARPACPSAQCDHLGCADWAPPGAQSDHLSSQRVPERSPRDTPHVCAGADAPENTAAGAGASAVSPEAREDGVAAPTPPAATLATPAQVVQAFYARFHGVPQAVPTAKEHAQAAAFLAAHGPAATQFLLDFAHREAPKTGYQPATFAGILPYASRALAAFARQPPRRAPPAGTAAHAPLAVQYEVFWREAVTQSRTTLPPEDLAALEATVRAQVLAEGQTPAFALALAVRLATDQVLATRLALPTYDAWVRQQTVARAS